MKLSLVIPCYNEEENIPLLYEAILEDFADVDFEYELVFVNDGSKDKTLPALKKLLDGEIPVKIIDFSRNFGKEAAMYAGLKNACGDYVAVIDADLQQKPSLVLKMVNILDTTPSYDCVAAYQEDRREGKILTFFKNTFYKLINKFSEVEFTKGASDFRTFRRKMLDDILELQEYFRFSKGLFSWVGYNTCYIPYKAEERAKGETKWSFKKLFAYALEGIFAFTVAPLRLATGAGIASILFAFLYVAITIVFRFFDKITLSASAPIVFIVSFIGGLQLFCLGIVGEYLARTYIQTKGRPIYIAKEIITNSKED